MISPARTSSIRHADEQNSNTHEYHNVSEIRLSGLKTPTRFRTKSKEPKGERRAEQVRESGVQNYDQSSNNGVFTVSFFP